MKRKIKVILVGESQVGKTSLITQFKDQKFKIGYIATFSNDRIYKNITIDNETLNLEIWDTIGQEKMRALNKIFMKNTDIALLIYDVTNQRSFDEIKYWHKVIEDVNGKDNVVFSLVGNKSDLYENQVININEGKKLGDELNMDFFETSAKDFESINKVFINVCKLFSEKEKKKQKDINLYDSFKNNKINSKENDIIQKENNNEKNININNIGINNSIILTTENNKKKKKKFKC